jgi:RND family efflux transporter MFP subunit
MCVVTKPEEIGMGRMKSALLAALVVATTFPVGLGGCRRAPEEAAPVRPVRAIRVGDATQLTRRVFPGRAKAAREVDLSFRVAGPLVARPVDVGDDVVAGQELATIDPRDFEVRLRSTQAQLEEARAVQRRSADEFERAQAAYDKGGLTEIELTRSREAAAAAVARVAQLEAAVEAEQDALDYTHLQAPFGGTIVAIYVENHEDVYEKQKVMRLLDDSTIEMIIEIPEQLISLAPEVEEVWCRFDAFPDLDVPASLKEIGTEASASTRTYPVTLSMEQPEGVRILPGMTGEARGRPRAAVLDEDGLFEVPMSAILSTDGSTSAVWVVDDESRTVSLRRIEPDRTTRHGMLVRGLERGEWIAVAGVHYLREGQPVRIMDEPAADGGDA